MLRHERNFWICWLFFMGVFLVLRWLGVVQTP